MRLIILLLISFSTYAQEYRMPRENLKSYLNMYEKTRSNSKVVCAVSQGRAIEVIEDYGKWLKVNISLCTGYVWKASTVIFEQKLTHLQGLAADQILIHVGSTEGEKVGKLFYFTIGEWCYFIDVDSLKGIPEGKENAITIREHINNQGGFDKLTDEIKENCNFH